MKPSEKRKVEKSRAPRNRTLQISELEMIDLKASLVRKDAVSDSPYPIDKVIHGDAFEILPGLRANSVDLLFADPPYNLTKEFGTESFRQRSLEAYEDWLERWIVECRGLLKLTASVYICGDWRSASPIQRVGSKYFKLRNRITWEREKGRGSHTNWKNSSEDIWFFTVSDDYTFNVEDVQLKRKVVAPYTQNGSPKDWTKSDEGNFRLTYPSNLWSDITVPFWSMPENTDHPTQKPEKLLAKIVLASSNRDDLVLDPFLGSGTTAVVAKKLGRHFIGVEADESYCLVAEKRLRIAEQDRTIQGYSDGVFWERNSLSFQNSKTPNCQSIDQPSLI